MRMPLKNGLILLTAATIWGAAFVAQSVGMDYMGPFTFNGLRYFLGAAVLVPFLLIKKRRGGSTEPEAACASGADVPVRGCWYKDLEAAGVLQADIPGRGGQSPEPDANGRMSGDPYQAPDRPMTSAAPLFTRRALAGGFFCGLFLCVASNLQQVAIISVDVGKAGFLTAMYIVIVPVLSFLQTGRTSLRLWVSVALAGAGLYFLSISGAMQLQAGDILLICCAIVFSMHIMCIDRFGDVDGVLLSCLQFVVAGILSLAAALVRQETITAGNVLAGWFPLVYAGVFSCGIAYTFQIIGQKGVDPSIASLILSLESVVSVLAGFLLLGQALSARELLGCVLMFAAIILVQLPERRKASVSAG